MKLRKLGLKLGLLGIALALPVMAADHPDYASISGYVRNAAGAPQMGAMVEVLGSAAHSLKIFTDENGFYSASGLLLACTTSRHILLPSCPRFVSAWDCVRAAAFWSI